MPEHEGTFYTVANSEEGTAALTGKAPLSIARMPVEGWSINRIEEAGMEISVFRVAPGAVYGSHAASFACVCLVAEGAGELFLTDDAGRELAAVSCRKGDAYLQGPDVKHGFRNLPGQTTLIYVRVVWPGRGPREAQPTTFVRDEIRHSDDAGRCPRDYHVAIHSLDEEAQQMKVVGVISSPHDQGNGATLVREALRGAAEAGASVVEVFLPRYRIEYCRDCGACVRSGRCALRDDFQELRDLLFEADGLILSSPNYGNAVCARMKNLMDRLGQYAYLTSRFGGKHIAALATASSFGAARAAAQLSHGFRDSVFRRAYVSGTLGVHLRGQHVSALPKALLQARGLGRRLAADIRSCRRYPLQNLLGRLPNALLVRPLIKRAILANKERMSGVYEKLVRSGIVGRSAA